MGSPATTVEYQSGSGPSNDIFTVDALFLWLVLTVSSNNSGNRHGSYLIYLHRGQDGQFSWTLADAFNGTDKIFMRMPDFLIMLGFATPSIASVVWATGTAEILSASRWWADDVSPSPYLLQTESGPWKKLPIRIFWIWGVSVCLPNRWILVQSRREPRYIYLSNEIYYQFLLAMGSGISKMLAHHDQDSASWLCYKQPWTVSVWALVPGVFPDMKNQHDDIQLPLVYHIMGSQIKNLWPPWTWAGSWLSTDDELFNKW